jgi:hypothetical protein
VPKDVRMDAFVAQRRTAFVAVLVWVFRRVQRSLLPSGLSPCARLLAGTADIRNAAILALRNGWSKVLNAPGPTVGGRPQR